MLLSRETSVRVTDIQSNIALHLGYAAYKLWNTCNFERKTYNASAGGEYPDWYYQKSAHKEDLWYKALPSQTAQEVCKLLDKAWKSYFKLLKTGGIANPGPPRYKHEPMPVTYMQNGIKRVGDNKVRLTLSRGFKAHMAERYGIHEDYLVLENSVFKDMDTIKQLKLYPPEGGTMRLIVIYEGPDTELMPDNGRDLSIDPGVHNLMDCYFSEDDGFIIGRKYLSIARLYDKEIARVQGQWAARQVERGIKYPRPSKHVLALYEKKRHCIKDYLHKVTRYITDYCIRNDIHTVIIGDITGIRKNKDCSDRINQELHALPYRKIKEMLGYKLKLEGIRVIMVNEAYSSQCSPLSPEVSRRYASPGNRVRRGLYTDAGHAWNADSVGAYNIMRLYFRQAGITRQLEHACLSSPRVIKVAA